MATLTLFDFSAGIPRAAHALTLKLCRSSRPRMARSIVTYSNANKLPAPGR